MEGVPDGFFNRVPEIEENISKIEPTEVQKNYNEIVNGEDVIINKKLSTERYKYYRNRIDEAEARGDIKAADDARYERYCEDKMNCGKESKTRDKWDIDNERLKEIRKRSTEQETKGIEALAKFLNRDLENNNKGKVITHTFDGKTVRPDSIGRNTTGQIDLVQDHKHFMDNTEKQIIYNDAQMQAERDMLEDKTGKHVVTMSSDNPHLDEIPPNPRPSGPLAEESDIYYSDPESGEITRKWAIDQETGKGYWQKL